MSKKIISHKESYVSLPTYLEVRNRIKADLANAVRSMLYDFEPEEVKVLVKSLSTNVESVVMDLDKHRSSQREVVSAPMMNKIKTSRSYELYMKDYVSTQITDTQLISIYAHIKGLKTYQFKYSSTQKCRAYTFGTTELSLPEIEPKFEEMIRGTNCSIQVNSLPMHFVLECVMRNYNMDEALAKGFPFTGSYDGVNLNVLMKKIMDLDFDFEEGNPKVNMMPFSEGGNDMRIPVFGSNVELKMSAGVFHRGIDRMGLMSNGSITKSIFESLGLDTKLNGEQMLKHFHDFLDSSKVGSYTFYNSTFIEDVYKEGDPIRVKSLASSQLLAVPGCSGFVLRMTKDVIPTMTTWILFSSFKQAYLKFHFLLSLVNFYRPINYCDYIDLFCRRVGHMGMRPVLRAAFSLFSGDIHKDIDVTTRINKLSTRIQGALQNVLGMMTALEVIKIDDDVSPINFDTFGFVAGSHDEGIGKVKLMGKKIVDVDSVKITNRDSVVDQQSDELKKYRSEQRMKHEGEEQKKERLNREATLSNKNSPGALDPGSSRDIVVKNSSLVPDQPEVVDSLDQSKKKDDIQILVEENNKEELLENVDFNEETDQYQGAVNDGGGGDNDEDQGDFSFYEDQDEIGGEDHDKNSESDPLDVLDMFSGF